MTLCVSYFFDSGSIGRKGMKPVNVDKTKRKTHTIKLTSCRDQNIDIFETCPYAPVQAIQGVSDGDAELL